MTLNSSPAQGVATNCHVRHFLPPLPLPPHSNEMEARQLILLDRLIAIRAFIETYAEFLAGICPPSIVSDLDRLIEAMQRVHSAQKEKVDVLARAERDVLRKRLIVHYAKPILTAASAAGLKSRYVRFRRPTRYVGRRFAIYMDTLLTTARADAEPMARRLVPGFIEAARELAIEYGQVNARAQSETAHAPNLTAAAVDFSSQATALVAHIHALISPHIADHSAKLAWREVRQLPSHHVGGPRRLRGAAQPAGLLGSGPAIDLAPDSLAEDAM